MRPTGMQSRVCRIIFRVGMAVSTFGSVCSIFWPGPIVRLTRYILVALFSIAIVIGSGGNPPHPQ